MASNRKPGLASSSSVLKIFMACFWFGLGLFSGCSCEYTLRQVTKPPLTDIYPLLEQQQNAWNNGDLEGFMSAYWNSPYLVFRSGDDVTKGYEATLDCYKKRYQQDGAEMGQLTFSDVEIERGLGYDAIVTGRWKLKRKADELSGLFTLRMRKLPEGWRIISDHTSSKEK